ncbi:uncharacterized protein LOC144120710 [Amblyomma americanum]|uniref:Secreted protein n=1 Tax=Amblyomma americanum TaxID=6943 RepID=A0A0C9R5B0_AMBAM
MFTTLLATACWLSVSAAEKAVEKAVETPTTPSPLTAHEQVVTSAGNATRRNSTTATFFNIAGMEQANGVVLRAFYVIVGVMMIILVYFVVRIVRSRYRRSKTRRYGIIASHSAELEMQPLDRADDEEEETTLFEAGKR